jgi:hypothetical protein
MSQVAHQQLQGTRQRVPFEIVRVLCVFSSVTTRNVESFRHEFRQCFEQVERLIASNERQQLPESVDPILKAIAKVP